LILSWYCHGTIPTIPSVKASMKARQKLPNFFRLPKFHETLQCYTTLSPIRFPTIQRQPPSDRSEISKFFEMAEKQRRRDIGFQLKRVCTVAIIDIVSFYCSLPRLSSPKKRTEKLRTESRKRQASERTESSRVTAINK
jgi:hypothetical protein